MERVLGPKQMNLNTVTRVLDQAWAQYGMVGITEAEPCTFLFDFDREIFFFSPTEKMTYITSSTDRRGQSMAKSST